MRKNIQYVAGMIADHYNMKGVPCCITEDATTTVLRLDCMLKTNQETGEEEVWIEGFTKPLRVREFVDFDNHFHENKGDVIAR